MKDKRNSPLRRQFNESFCSPDGQLSWAKSMANFGQLSALYHFTLNFSSLMDKPEAMLVIMGFVVTPDIIKKIIAMKYGGSAK